MENNKIKFVNLSGNAILKNMSNNPDDLYPPTHIFPYTDPGPEAALNEYKNFDYEIETGNGFKKYKLDWQNSYMIDQWQLQHRMHETDGVFKMFLKHDVDIEMIEEPSIISNIENYIDAQEETIIII